MGLSRKLGGGTTSRAEVAGHVDYTWSTQAYTIRDILAKFQLPCVVQCSGDAANVRWADFRFDMRQPLLLHAARTVRKMHARSLQIVEPSRKLEEFGPPLAIPEDYDGWFFPVARNQDPALLPRHTRVEGVSASSSRQFLVTTPLPAFTPVKVAAASGPKHVQHEVSVGEVLTKVGVMKGDPSVAPSSPSALVQRSRQSLRCVDESQHEVLIPFSHRALLLDVAENYGATNSSGLPVGGRDPQIHSAGSSSPGVVHTHTIVTVGNKFLPRVFRHVLGELPALTQTFTGLLRCYSVFTEETVMAATMSRTHLHSVLQESSCLELATDSSAKFKIALNGSELKKTNQYILALQTCEELAPTYVRAIKASFTIQPVVLQAGNVDMPGQTQSKETPQLGSTKTDGVQLESSVKTPALNKNSVTDVVRLGTGHGTTETCEPLELDDIHDNESTMTDDVPNSMLDTVSLSDATDMCSDNVSDMGDVEASSEFDFTWGQLKRAKSFTGSISTLTDDSETSSTVTESESEESVVLQEPLDTSASQNGTLTKEGNSSTSEDTVVWRTSAPSPVYANVPKKLSVYNPGQNDDASCEVEPPFLPSTVEEKRTDFKTVDSALLDNSVRSVWNITPTVELQQEASLTAPLERSENTAAANPIWWGDRAGKAENSSDIVSTEESGSSTLEHPLKNFDRYSITARPTAPSKLSVYDATGSQPILPPHPLHSSRLSVRSEGSAQDLAIQRLERALSDANNFLQSHTSPEAPPAPPPRRGKSRSVDVHSAGGVYSGQDGDRQCGVQARPPSVSGVQRSLPPANTAASNSLPADNPLAVSPSQHSVSYHRTFSAPDRQALYPHEHKMQAMACPGFRHRHNAPENTARHQSDSQLNSAHVQATNHHGEGQIDLDFVKTLGDRLLAVSRKSSLPKYQRLQPDSDNTACFENEDGCRLQKQQQRSGIVPAYRKQESAVERENGDEVADSDSTNASFGKDWNSEDDRQEGAILTDLDLLDEEVV